MRNTCHHISPGTQNSNRITRTPILLFRTIRREQSIYSHQLALPKHFKPAHTVSPIPNLSKRRSNDFRKPLLVANLIHQRLRCNDDAIAADVEFPYRA